MFAGAVMTIWALSGFLGLPCDWEVLKSNDLVGIDLMQFSLESYKSWADEFNQFIEKQQSHFNVLMGYSLGGRLALHALIERPSLWNAAIIISTHPGLNSDLEKKQRLADDEKWADLFSETKWDDLMKMWNSREVFQSDTFSFQRNEKDYSREQLVKILANLSLGNQAFLKDSISQLSTPMLWMTGEEDQKFSRLGEQLQFSHPSSKRMTIPNVGHRVPWGNPAACQTSVQIFLSGFR